jgi:hypothetical protein
MRNMMWNEEVRTQEIPRIVEPLFFPFILQTEVPEASNLAPYDFVVFLIASD